MQSISDKEISALVLGPVGNIALHVEPSDNRREQRALRRSL